MVPWHVLDVFDDVNNKLYAFEQLFVDVIDQHTPLKQTHIRGNQVPFMTREWHKTIRHHNRLKKNSHAEYKA